MFQLIQDSSVRVIETFKYHLGIIIQEFMTDKNAFLFWLYYSRKTLQGRQWNLDTKKSMPRK